MESVKEEVDVLINEESLKDVPMLIFANKQDLPDAIKVNEIGEILNLNDVKRKQVYIRGVCAISGDDVNEGFNWLS